MQALNKIVRYSYVALALGVLSFSSCRKETSYEYGVNEVTVQQPGSKKTTAKTTQEFISIAYTDLFGKQITQTELIRLNTTYDAFGDKKLIEDMIIKNFLNKPGVSIPTATAMRKDVMGFINDTFKKFLNREPQALEKWYLAQVIEEDASVTPELIYYSIMTCNEYRYY